MRLKVIACKVLFREISYFASVSENFLDITYLRQSFHDQPEILREMLQNEIDKIDSGDDPHTYKPHETLVSQEFDAIVIAYGLCSNAILGLSSKKYKIVVPRAHDCITLMLGSKERYRDYFDTHKGIYWYSKGWIENAAMPSEERYQAHLNNYTQLYGEDNAEYLMEMEQGWFREYERCTFINQEGIPNQKEKEYTKKSAVFLNWQYEEIAGDHSLIREMLSGNWEESKFLIIPQGKKISASYDEDILKCE